MRGHSSHAAAGLAGSASPICELYTPRSIVNHTLSTSAILLHLGSRPNYLLNVTMVTAMNYEANNLPAIHVALQIREKVVFYTPKSKNIKVMTKSKEYGVWCRSRPK